MSEFSQTPTSTPAQTGGDDAVCFTSGPSGAPFGAGVVHAWLAMDRKPPLVSAGISMGAVSAAAMQRVYRELREVRPDVVDEERRWKWYRRYLTGITQNLTKAVWNCVPDPVDFYTDKPPVRDTSVPPVLKSESEKARRHYVVLTKLGLWLAHLPIRVSTVADIAVQAVRLKEGYGDAFVSSWSMFASLCKVLAGVVWHLLRSPSMFNEADFKEGSAPRSMTPLFGRVYWTVAGYAVLALAVCAAALLGVVYLIRHGHWIWIAALAIAAVLLVVYAHAKVKARITSGSSAQAGGEDSWPVRFAKKILCELDIQTALLKPYELKRLIHDMFVVGAPAPAQGDVELLAVCAALESLDQVCVQESRSPAVDFSMADVLASALAVPGLFPPQVVDTQHIHSRAISTPSGYANLIDGAAVRSNPIPAFFEWCKDPENSATAGRLESIKDRTRKLHVVYNVPITYRGDARKAAPPESIDIVESASTAMQLAKRRDTRQEVRQTNQTSELQAIRLSLTGTAKRGPRGPFVIFADEIAPATDIDLGNDLQPDPVKSMEWVSHGCRSTLETLYRTEIQTMGGGKNVKCSTLIGAWAGRRPRDANGEAHGLPEICGKCSGSLRYVPESEVDAPAHGIARSYGDAAPGHKVNVAAAFPHLDTLKQKVVFLGSGGVFRGAFHIGVIAAMKTVRLCPDLVVGASVGSLMGGALAHITAGPAANGGAVVEQLADLFLHVDEKVALTKTLKNATKQLGTRARTVTLSPSELARMVSRGSKADAGFASTGAPPALIDALSYLFTIPHRETAEIASEFIAGHMSAATARFLKQMRRETLSSFDIETAFMGASLLEVEVRRLLGGGVPAGLSQREAAATGCVLLNSPQPYHHPAEGGKAVSFFGMTSFVNARVGLLLGRDFLTDAPTWDAVYAGLSSSAFPAVFAPRTESDVLPGRGRTDRYFADGGMFDNLPFMPAIEVLADVQRTSEALGETTLQYRLCERARRPNLFIAAGLDAQPDDPAKDYDTLFKISARAGSLSVKSKVDTFIRGADKTRRDLRKIRKYPVAQLPQADQDFLEATVSAKVVNITPTDAEHINPTFAFCKATGLQKERVERSIADGCYRSLREFASNQEVKRYMQGMTSGRVQSGSSVGLTSGEPGEPCPYFKTETSGITCPFSQSSKPDVQNIFMVCAADEAHVLASR